MLDVFICEQRIPKWHVLLFWVRWGNINHTFSFSAQYLTITQFLFFKRVNMWSSVWWHSLLWDGCPDVNFGISSPWVLMKLQIILKIRSTLGCLHFMRESNVGGWVNMDKLSCLWHCDFKTFYLFQYVLEFSLVFHSMSLPEYWPTPTSVTFEWGSSGTCSHINSIVLC